jgi:hypothetical protein
LELVAAMGGAVLNFSLSKISTSQAIRCGGPYVNLTAQQNVPPPPFWNRFITSYAKKKEEEEEKTSTVCSDGYVEYDKAELCT